MKIFRLRDMYSKDKGEVSNDLVLDLNAIVLWAKFSRYSALLSDPLAATATWISKEHVLSENKGHFFVALF